MRLIIDIDVTSSKPVIIRQTDNRPDQNFVLSKEARLCEQIITSHFETLVRKEIASLITGVNE